MHFNFHLKSILDHVTRTLFFRRFVLSFKSHTYILPFANLFVDWFSFDKRSDLYVWNFLPVIPSKPLSNKQLNTFTSTQRRSFGQYTSKVTWVRFREYVHLKQLHSLRHKLFSAFVTPEAIFHYSYYHIFITLVRQY